MFDCAGFIKAVLRQDRTEIRSYFADDAVINWHCTNECFTVDESKTLLCSRNSSAKE